MATAPQQGIMSLPPKGGQPDQPAPQLGLDDSYDAIRGGLSEANPQASAQVQEQLNQMLPALDQLTDEQLDSLLQIVQYMHDHEEEYPKLVAELVQQGVVDEGTFPEQYSPEVIATLGMVLLEAKRQRRASSQMPQPPATMARGGIADAARFVAGHGRSGDTMLAHINSKEAAMLRKQGGVGTINPATGLPEYGFFSKVVGAVTGATKGVVNGIVNTVKSVASSTVGKILITAALATFLGPGAFTITGMNLGAGAALGLASAGASILGGGNFKDALQAGAKGYFLGAVGAAAGAPLGSATGVTSAAGQAALGTGAAGTGLGLLTGQSLKDSVKSGLTAATIAGLSTGAAKGFDSPAQAAAVKVDSATGQVTTGGQPTVPNAAPVDSNAAFEKSWTDAQSGADAKSWNTAPPPAQTNWTDSVKKFYNENFSPSAREQAGTSGAIKAVQEQFPGVTQDQILNAPSGSVLAKAFSAASPGIFSTYGPAIAAGLGITGLAGGFSSKPVQPSGNAMNIASGQATRDLMDTNPKNYYTQNLPGVQYDTAGNITGSSPWTPRSGGGNTEVASSNYIPYSSTYTPPPTYTTPTAAIGGGHQVAQPYNTAAMYDFRPRYAAQGGMMETQGAFPANPLTAQSNPAMAMGAQQLPMNTSGVPMNLPMGLAMGGMPPAGIASLAPGGYPRRTGQIEGPGTETSDDIPAMLSDGEFVMTAKAVKNLGKGDRRAGAKRMYDLMHRLEKNAARPTPSAPD